MNLAQFSQQVRREAKANPKQATVLGLLLLVAVYYWAPLLAGWIPTDEGPIATAPPPTADVTTPDTNQSKPSSTPNKTIRWHDLVQWIGQDPLRTSNKELVQLPDPFQMEELALAHRELQIKEEQELQVKSDALGLTVESTVVGLSRSVALINGRAYSVGSRIAVGQAASRRIVEVLEIHADQVILGSGSQRLELPVKPNPIVQALTAYDRSDSND